METCRCGDVFEDHESMGAELGICQMCWETYCANTWWNAVNAINTEEKEDENVPSL